MDLGSYIRSLREARRLTYREIQTLTNGEVSYEAVRKIEEGLTKNPGLGTILAIAKVLGVPYDNLVAAYMGKNPAEGRVSDPSAYKNAVLALLKELPEEVLLEERFKKQSSRRGKEQEK